MLDIFTRWSQGLTSDTWNLKYSTLSRIAVVAPQVEEQTAIATFFNSFDHLITTQQRKLETLKRLKQFMLQNLFV
jgi:type I restriction enzyme S subunit